MKAYLQHKNGANLDARETLKILGKKKYQYESYYEICLGYETVIQKKMDMETIKDFIRPKIEYIVEVCTQDHSNFYYYMLLTVLLLTENKISLKDA